MQQFGISSAHPMGVKLNPVARGWEAALGELAATRPGGCPLPLLGATSEQDKPGSPKCSLPRPRGHGKARRCLLVITLRALGIKAERFQWGQAAGTGKSSLFV